MSDITEISKPANLSLLPSRHSINNTNGWSRERANIETKRKRKNKKWSQLHTRKRDRALMNGSLTSQSSHSLAKRGLNGLFGHLWIFTLYTKSTLTAWMSEIWDIWNIVWLTASEWQRKARVRMFIMEIQFNQIQNLIFSSLSSSASIRFLLSHRHRWRHGSARKSVTLFFFSTSTSTPLDELSFIFKYFSSHSSRVVSSSPNRKWNFEFYFFLHSSVSFQLQSAAIWTTHK